MSNEKALRDFEALSNAVAREAEDIPDCETMGGVTLRSYILTQREQLAAEHKRREELEQELARVHGLPEMEWARVTSTITQMLAAIARMDQPASRVMLAVLDDGKVYVGRLKARAELAEADNAALTARLQAVCDAAMKTDWMGKNGEREARFPWDEIEFALRDLHAKHPGAALLERMRALETFVRGFSEMAANAIAHHTGPKTGMRVPYHDDFANLPPSGVSALERWLRTAIDVLKVTHE